MKKIQRSEELPYQDFDDQLVLVQPKKREVHLMNETAGAIWKMIEKGVSLDELVEALCREYEVGPEEAEKEVAAFLKEMKARGLIQTA